LGDFPARIDRQLDWFQIPAGKSFSFEPMLCESAERPPDGLEWRFELKLDGFRAIGRKSGRSAQLWSAIRKTSPAAFPAW
jgi:ATP-dependent DNA ligase